MVHIIPFQPLYLTAVKQLIFAIILEFQLVPIAGATTVQDIAVLVQKGQLPMLEDLDHIQELYFDKRGTFLVALDGDTVVGTGALQYFNDTCCELRRIYFTPTYRGRGFGSQMVKTLIEQAKQLGYKTIYLDVYKPQKQQAAITLYRKLGFKEIQPYHKSPAELFMALEI